ncbi:reductive dehalogenase [Alkalibacter saccharofermentans]|uniref:Reductive dehalogenase n=1 Tax=Alkalibacter saccharofermentans DSM 14828 TaxID=1120975 RepID=A0A1M4T370_9FIRM|nr:reductive dehalogenase [Alkalibacter saccharofermentans]SHE38798.1 reductive dehalogenase [Alkalibacter saccharofermentans DSM 14828]
MIPRKEMKKSESPIDIKEGVYERFPVTRQAFVTVSFQDAGEIGYNHWMNKMMENMVRRMMSGEEGRRQEDNALDLGANALNLLIGEYGFPNFQFLKWSPLFVPDMLANHPVNMPSNELSNMVKKAAVLYGADLVGIASLDPKWVYSKDLFKSFEIVDEGSPQETEDAFLIPRKVNKAIVMAVAMDDEMIETSPLVDASTATSLGYSRMGITAVSLAEYIRGLGYQAIPCMNDTALSIPLAVEAGLGQLGRLGLLITPEFGPNVRLMKVLTDMPLENDHAIDFGIPEFCDNCHLCAEHCPSSAISFGEQSYDGICDNNNSGIKKWYISAEKCLRLWQTNGASCANCIAVCPFTRGFESMQCFECKKCETKTGCELQVNTHLRAKYGYLDVDTWGNKPKVLKPRRRGL